MVDDTGSGDDYVFDGDPDAPGDSGVGVFPGGDPPDEYRCHATSKTTGERCKHWVMRGKRVCRMHGGKSPSGPGSGRPIKHGLYSKFRQKLEDLDAENEVKEADLTPELEFLRSVLHRLDSRLTDVDLADPEQVEILSKIVREIRQIVAVMRRPTEVTALEVRLVDTYMLEAIRLALEDLGGQQLVAQVGARAAQYMAEHRAITAQRAASALPVGGNGI